MIYEKIRNQLSKINLQAVLLPIGIICLEQLLSYIKHKRQEACKTYTEI